MSARVYIVEYRMRDMKSKRWGPWCVSFDAGQPFITSGMANSRAKQLQDNAPDCQYRASKFVRGRP